MLSKERLEYLNKLSESIIGAAIEVHKYLGPGLLINFNVPRLIDGIRRKVNG
ncbi:MAG: hypothetical protein IJ901_04580 [Bacteroidaceae bacterium]|nr:hypothetical protein [Bacteroidaceae bacterium]